MKEDLRAKLKTLPSSPGVYFHKSASGEIIYVGKAAVLKNRVRQYFQSKKDMDAKTLALVAEIADTDWIETDSELDALFLEAEMVKRYMPRYNIALRDDKSQMYVRIDMKSEIPFVSFTRQPLDDGAEYIGLFYNGGAVKNALRYLRKIFPYFMKKSELKSALLLQLGLIPDVKTGAQKTAYKKSLRQLISYIKGNRVKVQNEIEKEMKAAAKNHDFETAAKLRNQLYNLNELRRQIIFSREEFLDISKDQALKGLQELLSLPEIPRRIEAYDISHISGTNNVASMVVATNGVADRRQYRKFKISRDRNDDTAAMREVITRRLKHLKDWGRPDLVIIDGGIGQLNAVADLLLAEKISFLGRNKSGDHTRNAKVQIMIPKQENATSNLSRDLDSKKDSSADARNDKMAYETIDLQSDSHVAKLIARLDEEAHRFAVTYHQNLRAKKQTENALEQIPGIGPATRKKLLRKFGSINGIKNASETEIAQIIGDAKARLVKKNLNNPAGQNPDKLVILASQSPRRRELLSRMGVNFSIIPAEIDENSIEASTLSDLVRDLAMRKAQQVARQNPTAYVIGSDTMISFDNRQIGKVSDVNQARELLTAYSGRKVKIYSGVAVVNLDKKVELVGVDSAELLFKLDSDETRLEREKYLKSGDWRDKAGAFGIQSGAAELVERIDGDIDVIIGLPTRLLAKLLSEVGIATKLPLNLFTISDK